MKVNQRHLLLRYRKMRVHFLKKKIQLNLTSWAEILGMQKCIEIYFKVSEIHKEFVVIRLQNISFVVHIFVVLQNILIHDKIYNVK